MANSLGIALDAISGDETLGGFVRAGQDFLRLPDSGFDYIALSVEGREVVSASVGITIRGLTDVDALPDALLPEGPSRGRLRWALTVAGEREAATGCPSEVDLRVSAPLDGGACAWSWRLRFGGASEERFGLGATTRDGTMTLCHSGYRQGESHTDEVCSATGWLSVPGLEHVERVMTSRSEHLELSADGRVLTDFCLRNALFELMETAVEAAALGFTPFRLVTGARHESATLYLRRCLPDEELLPRLVRPESTSVDAEGGGLAFAADSLPKRDPITRLTPRHWHNAKALHDTLRARLRPHLSTISDAVARAVSEVPEGLRWDRFGDEPRKPPEMQTVWSFASGTASPQIGLDPRVGDYYHVPILVYDADAALLRRAPAAPSPGALDVVADLVRDIPGLLYASIALVPPNRGLRGHVHLRAAYAFHMLLEDLPGRGVTMWAQGAALRAFRLRKAGDTCCFPTLSHHGTDNPTSGARVGLMLEIANPDADPVEAMRAVDARPPPPDGG